MCYPRGGTFHGGASDLNSGGMLSAWWDDPKEGWYVVSVLKVSPHKGMKNIVFLKGLLQHLLKSTGFVGFVMFRGGGLATWDRDPKIKEFKPPQELHSHKEWRPFQSIFGPSGPRDRFGVILGGQGQDLKV